MTYVTSFGTGSRRGYIRVGSRGKESGMTPIPSTLTGIRGNKRKALDWLVRNGCTHYTIAWYQGVPGKGYSNQYCYATYRGYN